MWRTVVAHTVYFAFCGLRAQDNTSRLAKQRFFILWPHTHPKGAGNCRRCAVQTPRISAPEQATGHFFVGGGRGYYLPDRQAYGSHVVGATPSKKIIIHIDASHSRQPLVKGERLVRYEVNAVMSATGVWRVSKNLLVSSLGVPLNFW